MTQEPRTQDEVYNSLRESLTGKITKLTNFTERSFNYIWTQAYAEEIRELEVRATVSELAGWIDYTGGPVTNEDLEQLGIEDRISADEVDEFMQENYLDEYIKLVGVERFEGLRATGEVEITIDAGVDTIEEGIVVTTAESTFNQVLEFRTTEEIDTSSFDEITTVTVSVEAVEVGNEYNVPAETIIRISDPPIGFRGVTNSSSITGGENRETNEDLRERAKGTVRSASLGGTTDGIKGYIRQEVKGVGQGDVVIQEFFDSDPTFVDVVVDGGDDGLVADAIDFSRPTGIQHNLVRPEVISLGFDIDVRGDDVDTTFVENSLTDDLLLKGIGENFYQDELISDIFRADRNVLNVDNLGGVIERVENEEFIYDNTQTDYRLEYTYESTNGSITVVDESGDSYAEGSDFEVNDQSGDGYDDTLVWIGNTPDDTEKFTVDYDVTVLGQTTSENEYDTNLVRDESFNFNEGVTETFTYESGSNLYEIDHVPFDGSSSITDGSGDTYTEGTDYDIVDNSGNGFAETIDWSIGGSTPTDNEDFTVTYNQKVYQTEYEQRDTPLGIIRDFSGDVYDRGTEYETVDYKPQDDEKDAIEWLTNPSTLDSDEEFFFTYFTEGDVIVSDRQKVNPGTITIESI